MKTEKCPTKELKKIDFKQEFYPQVSSLQWNNWKWQLANRITTKDQLAKILRLSQDELMSFKSSTTCLPFSITPYYASLLEKGNASQALRRTVVPSVKEQNIADFESEDHLNEAKDSPVPCIVHRYPDRVLFLATNFCSTYCRYCTRSRMVGGHEHYSTHELWENAIDYIKNHKEIRDVLISGGDPLTMETAELEWLLSRLRAIDHVEFLRIGTKVPAVLPQRINIDLVNMLKKYHPLFISLHFTHPDELTPQTAKACTMLADAGIPLGSQTVLLKGVNDDIKTMTKLFQGLLKFRVKPYYLYQCDLVPGTSHFRTSVNKGIEIIHGLRGFTSGYAVPQYVIDLPHGGGKIPFIPEYLVGKKNKKIMIKNYKGDVYTYPDID